MQWIDVELSLLTKDRDGVVAELARKGYDVVDAVPLSDRPVERLFLESRRSGE